MKKLFSILIISALFASCAPDKPTENAQGGKLDDAVAANANEGKGIGEVKNVTLNTPLEQDRIKRGKAIFEMKCSACHKLTDQRVVGPGWAGVTKKPQTGMDYEYDHQCRCDAGAGSRSAKAS